MLETNKLDNGLKIAHKIKEAIVRLERCDESKIKDEIKEETVFDLAQSSSENNGQEKQKDTDDNHRLILKV